MIMCKQNLVNSIHSQDMEQTPNSDRNSVKNLRKMTLYNPNIDLVNDNVYTKFGLNLSIRSQDMEQFYFMAISNFATLSFSI